MWERAAVRGLLMGRIGHAVGVDPWAAHSAGLFEECGKAVLFRHAPTRYKPLLATAVSDEELTLLEHQEFGVSHDACLLAGARAHTVSQPPALGDYLQAIGYLVRYRNYGGRIKTASARCYYSPSRTASRRRGISPGEPELHVREAILSLSWPSTEKTSG